MENNNVLGSGSLEGLQPGETLLINARQVSNGKIQLEFAEKIAAKDRPVSALTILNASDDRFSSGARRGWATAEPVDAANALGVNFGDDGDWYATERGEMMDLNILNPMFLTSRFRLQIVETTEGTEWQQANVERAAKRAGKDGDYITHDGQYIFSNSNVVLMEGDVAPTHTFLSADTTTAGVKPNVGIKVEEEESLEF